MATGLTFTWVSGGLCVSIFRLSGSITSHPAPRIFNKDKKEKHLAKSKIITNFKSTKQNAIQYKNIENLRKQGDL
jgi:hypothetical protein